MRRFLLTTTLGILVSFQAMAQMSDQEIMSFVARETRAGSSQSQIVTKLMQRGVKIDQIRRIRNQYDSQIKNRGLSGQPMALCLWQQNECKAIVMEP